MNINLSPTQVQERRSKPRMDCSYPAIVQGRDATGLKFRQEALLTNLSASGLCLEVNSEFQPGKDMFVLFRWSRTGPLGKDRAPLVAVQGEILRSEQSEPGMQTVALKIHRNRFL